MIWLKRIGLILLIICLGTVLDYIVHQMSPHFSVPDYYFTHKIWYGTLFAFIGYLVFRKKIHTTFWLAFTLAATPASLLQTMYFIQGHQEKWVVFLFLFLHFLFFLFVGYFICKKWSGVFLSQ